MSETPETTNTQVIVHIDPAFGEWIEREITPEMVRGKLMWLTMQITKTRVALAEAEDAALAAKRKYDTAFAAALDAAKRSGSTSQADTARTAARTTLATRQETAALDLQVKHLRDELDDLYRSQMPATQSLNRIVLAAWEADWRAAGTQP